MTPEATFARDTLLARRAEIEAAHRGGAPAFATCSALTMMMDDVIRAAFRTLEESARSQLAILALGGYGRAELCPHSDIDLMVLRAAGKDLESAGKAAKAFLHLLWDAGVDVGHSVRTVEEALALHGHSVDAWNSMLESRVICGDERLARTLYDRLLPGAAQSADRWLIEGILEEQRAMHERNGSSVKLLEPNIKKSAGGLRDLHSAFWLHRSHRAGFSVPHEPRDSALKQFLDLLLASGDLDTDEHRAVLRALEFLLKVRHEMHYLRDSLHDTLEYALQLQVAGGLGYRDQMPESPEGAVTRAVEVFMREYYMSARTVHSTSQRLNNRFREIVEPVRHPDHAEENVRGLFFLHSDVLSIAPGVTRLSSAEEVFEAFVIAAERDLELDFRLRAVIGRSLDLISEDQLASRDLSASFSRILNSGRVGATLRVMNDLDVLGTYLPEFGRLVAFFQHNVYHYFTADEHTIIAVANAESLRERQGLLREVFRMLRRKDLLYLAILFHDIAKPDGLADHEITGVAVAERVLRRLGMEELFPDVAFLIRHHLVMEQIAFRRNIHDPDTIKEFAGRFQHAELLDYLYVLTYADLSAVNTNVWTGWKSSILQELYQRTSEVLRRNLQGSQIDAFHQAKRDAAVEKIVDTLSATIPRGDVERHVRGLQNDSYFALFSEEEIARHIAAGDLRGPVDVAFVHSEGYTEITIVARDAPFALSKFCAVLAANDANIFDANVFTRDDGIIIDRFRVADATSRQRLEQRVCSKIADDLTKVMGGSLDIEHLFADHRRKWKRRPRVPANPSIRTDVEFEGTARFTIIDVYAADSVGFLYRVTETMSRMGLDIYFAKIATRVDGIVDAFYVLDRTGRPLSEPERCESVRQGILATIRRMADEELA
jgi:[protein-PII] uridylyltransferase